MTTEDAEDIPAYDPVTRETQRRSIAIIQGQERVDNIFHEFENILLAEIQPMELPIPMPEDNIAGVAQIVCLVFDLA